MFWFWISCRDSGMPTFPILLSIKRLLRYILWIKHEHDNQLNQWNNYTSKILKNRIFFIFWYISPARYHLGSAVFGSFIITLLVVVNWILGFIHKRYLPNKEDWVMVKMRSILPVHKADVLIFLLASLIYLLFVLLFLSIPSLWRNKTWQFWFTGWRTVPVL